MYFKLFFSLVCISLSSYVSAQSCQTTTAQGWHWAGEIGAIEDAKSNLPNGYTYVQGSASCSSTAPGAPVSCTVKGKKCDASTKVSVIAESYSSNGVCSEAVALLAQTYPSAEGVYTGNRVYNGYTGRFSCTAYGTIR